MDIDFKWLLRQQAAWFRANAVYNRDTPVFISSGIRYDGWCWGDRTGLSKLRVSRYCVVWWADNTFELLSRDEEERRLFATLLELER